ncbi:hypothetical protein CRENBAI_002074 [Crenichthys baileyi]|uniref:Uncharacterized protein n=1 Tax=Crenichthys baileyi TaxID=28760 RepID=A0AAV9RNS2_9TELE
MNASGLLRLLLGADRATRVRERPLKEPEQRWGSIQVESSTAEGGQDDHIIIKDQMSTASVMFSGEPLFLVISGSPSLP